MPYTRPTSAPGYADYNAANPITAAEMNWLDQKAREVVSPLDFGAVFDNVTDDTAAWQAMFATNPSKVFVPNGTGLSVISGQINVPGTCLIEASSGTGVRLVGAITAFNVTGSFAEIRGLYVMGDRTAGQIAFKLNAFGARLVGARVELVDTGVQVNGGFHVVLDNIIGRNIRSTFIDSTNGTETVHLNCAYDTDTGTYAQPLVAGIRTAQQGTLIAGCDMIHAGTGLLIEQTAASPAYWSKISGSYFDSCSGAGIHIINNYSGSGTFGTMPIGIFFDGVWSATCGQGLLIDSTYGVNGIYFDSCEFHNNVNEGARIATTNPTKNIRFRNCVFAGNSTTGAGVANSLYAQNVQGLQVLGCVFGKEFWPSNPNVFSHLFADTTVQSLVVRSNIFDAGFSSAVVTLALGAGQTTYGENSGFATEGGGTSAVAVGNSSVNVTHGLNVTPTDGDVWISDKSNKASSSITNAWISAYSSTTFTVTLNAAVAGSNYNFVWHARKIGQ